MIYRSFEKVDRSHQAVKHDAFCTCGICNEYVQNSGVMKSPNRTRVNVSNDDVHEPPATVDMFCDNCDKYVIIKPGDKCPCCHQKKFLVYDR